MGPKETVRSTHIPSRLPETNALITILKERAKENATLSRDEIKEVTGVEVESPKGQGRLRSAVRYLERHERIVWTNLRGQSAVQCLNAGGKLDSSGDFLDRARRNARRSRVRLSTVDTKKLDQGQKVTFSARAAIASAVEAQLSPKAIRPPKDVSSLTAIEASLSAVAE